MMNDINVMDDILMFYITVIQLTSHGLYQMLVASRRASTRVMPPTRLDMP